MMKDIIKNLCLAIASVIVIVSLIEFTLYLSGKIYYLYRVRDKASQSENKDLVRILCLGDSWTFGMGADKGYSYPEQLEKMLNKDNPNSVVVHNAGWPGCTSSKLLRRLEDDLHKYNPDILIILVGGNDTYLMDKDADYLLFKNDGFKSVAYRLDYYLSRSKVYKLCKRGWDGLLVKLWKKRLACKRDWGGLFAKLWKKRLASKFKSMGTSVSFGLKVTSSLPRDDKIIHEFQGHINLGEKYFHDNRACNLAIEEYKKAKALMPNNALSYICTAVAYAGMDKEEIAIKELKKAARMDPYNKEIYYQLWITCKQLGEEKLAMEALENYLYLNPDDIPKFLTFLKYGVHSLKENKSNAPFVKLVRFNLKKIINFSRKKR